MGVDAYGQRAGNVCQGVVRRRLVREGRAADRDRVVLADDDAHARQVDGTVVRGVGDVGGVDHRSGITRNGSDGIHGDRRIGGARQGQQHVLAHPGAVRVAVDHHREHAVCCQGRIGKGEIGHLLGLGPRQLGRRQAIVQQCASQRAGGRGAHAHGHCVGGVVWTLQGQGALCRIG